MNESMKEQTFYVRIEYEVIDDLELMEGFRPASGISLDVAGCAKPDMAAETGKYMLKSPKWISQVKATLLYSTGHMHDGGKYIIFSSLSLRFSMVFLCGYFHMAKNFTPQWIMAQIIG